jgi:mono/diheme cytochrome c family protein
MSKAVWGAVVAALLVVLGPVAAAQQVKREPIKPPDSVAGDATFKAYCAQCHGVAGKGNGPAAAALKMPPADLTTLAKRNNGTFPAGRIKNAVTGDYATPAHGTAEMPMWGPVFRSVENPSVTELRIVNLVKYLEQIQEKK